ncbi:two-component sensor histidine kinase [Actinomyces sp. 2119]|uniref:sensor histidine kinase n=1 Tax=Actinomyces sp. 2119 TaxID=2321393 RepID=UPI000E6BA03B|nr:histidine kinase [Actinomyces sp. 2119]RJF40231.1 two-component sensor histidine kinase [Actinomyces sp. 2119]
MTGTTGPGAPVGSVGSTSAVGDVLRRRPHGTGSLPWTAAVLVLVLLSATSAWEETGQWPVVAVVCVLGGVLWWRRLDADAVGTVVLAAGALQLALLDFALTADVLVLLALFRVGAQGRATLRPLWAVALVLGAFLAALRWNQDEQGVVADSLYRNDFRSVVLFVLGGGLLAWGAGRLLALRRDAVQARAAAQRARQAEEEQRLLAQVAAVRTRTAQDVHDVVGHALALVAVQAEAGHYLVTAPQEEVDLTDQQRLDQARGVLETVLTTTRKALEETRSLTHALAAGADHDGAASLYPAPGLDALPALVHEANRSGVPVHLTVQGEPGSHGPVDLGAQTALYRTAQEGITNAVRHVPAVSRIDVALVHAPDSLTLTVTNDAPAPLAVPNDSGSTTLAERLSGTAGGTGLRSLGHRVEAAGGRLQAEPLPGGGVVLRVQVPLP